MVLLSRGLALSKLNSPFGFQETLRATARLLLMYVVSAMTHIDEDIRVDSLSSIRLWLESGVLNEPSQMTKIFRNLVSLMAKDSKLGHGTAITSRMLGPKLKLEILGCFLRAIASLGVVGVNEEVVDKPVVRKTVSWPIQVSLRLCHLV